MTPPPVSVWGTRFAPLTLPAAVDAVADLVRAGRPTHVVTPNVHTLMLADRDPAMRAAIDRAALVLADGMPLVWAGRLRPGRLPARVAGSDLLPALCERAAREGWRVAFVGGPPGVGAAAADRLTARFPGLQVVAVESPPYRPLTPAEEADLSGRLRAAAPHLLVVAFGQPAGDLWAERHGRELGVPVAVNLGASLDFAAGRVRRAPRWVQRTGFEWLYRISREPRRMTGRYARNGLFLARMLARDLWRLACRRPLD